MQSQPQNTILVVLTELILVTTATTGISVLFQAGVLFSIEIAKFWRILAIKREFVHFLYYLQA